MVTAVDSSVLFDVLAGVDDLPQKAMSALEKAERSGRVLISAVCYGELALSFDTSGELDVFLRGLRLEVTPLDAKTAFLAGQFYRAYRLRGGTRGRVLPDFFIAAHAQLHADRILTRDHRFFTGVFPNLQAVVPDDL